ncbi:hypothetical protein N7535_000993 [Penicillium sp. DV-2018c]|nr:hypothetical protein N7461_005763 [Penicillium sp. DV-2018c]KAJ5582373.1 hypothetical protein N7535_000993 [Penicillium sp. DV-2018c]
MASSSNASDASKVRWQFIDSSNNSRANLTQVKRHVMQEYMRQKKGISRQSDSEEERPQKRRGTPKSNRVTKQRALKQARLDDGSNHKEPRGTVLNRKEHAAPTERETRRGMLADELISSRPLLADSGDMSTSLLFRPSSAQSQSHPFLVGGFANTSPHILQSHGLDLDNVSWSSSPTTPYQLFQSADSVISTAQNGPANTISPGPDRDGSILSDYHVDDVTTSSYGPHGPSSAALSRVHMQSAWDIIRARSAPAPFSHTRIGKLINPQDYILTGYETQELGLRSEYEQSSPVTSEHFASSPTQSLRSMPSPPCSTSTFSEVSPAFESQTMLPTPPTSSPSDESKLQCEEFLDFLRRCEQIALYQRENVQASYITRHTAVQESSILHQILTSPSGTRSTSSEGHKQDVNRMTALMILNAALWDYRYAPARAALFLSTLEKSLVDRCVGITGSVDTLLQILLECNDGSLESWSSSNTDGIASAAVTDELPDFSQYFPTATSPSARPWFAGRMLKIANRLSLWSWYRVSELLFSCLTLHVRGSSMALWEADLRKEILNAPLEWP